MRPFTLPLTKSEKRLFLGAGFLVACFLVGGFALSRRDMEPDWEPPVPSPLPVPNGYDSYSRAQTSFTIPTPAIDEIFEPRTHLSPAQAAQRYSLSRRSQWLNANRTGFRLLEKARQQQCRCPPIQFGHPDRRHPPNFFTLAGYQVAESNTYRLSGHPDKAFSAATNIVQMAYDSARGGSLGDRWRMQGLVRWAYRPMDAALPLLTGLQAANQAERLIHLHESAPTLKENTIVSKWEATNNLLLFMRTPNWRSKYPMSDVSGGSDLEWPERLRRLLVSERSQQEILTGFWDCAIEKSDQPFTGESLRPRNWEKDKYVCEFGPYEGGPSVDDCSATARIRMLIIRLRLHTYQKAHGAYPSSLKELKIPGLSELNDPFSDSPAPFLYRRQKNGYQLWSIGPDRTNNNASKKLTPVWHGFPRVQLESKGDVILSVPPIPDSPTPTPVPPTPDAA